MQLENGGLQCYVYNSMLPVHKAVIAGPAGPSSARSLFWPSMLFALSLLLVLAHLLCAYHLLIQLSITRVARVETLKNYNDTCLINFIIRWS